MRKEDFGVFEKEKELVYLDSSATSLKPKVVADEVSRYYNESGASVHRGIYGISADLTDRYENVREKAAKLIGAKKDEIVFTSGTTDAANKLFLILSENMAENLSQGDEVLVSIMEHNSVLLPLREFAKRHKLKVKYIGLDENNMLDMKSLEENITPRLKVVLVTHISNVLGTINPVEEISRLLKEKNRGALFIVDGAQSVPHIKVDVKEIGCDFFMFSAHKMCGPTGTGILYGRSELLRDMKSPLLGGHAVLDVTKDDVVLSDVPDRFEPGTPNISGVLGFGKAIDYLLNIGYDEIARNDKEIFLYAIEKLNELKGIDVIGSTKYENKVGIISFNIKDVHPHDVISILDRMKICIRGGHHCAMLLLHEMGIASCCRISFYVYNSKSDVDKLIEGLKKVKEIFSV